MLVRLVVIVALIVAATLTASLAMAFDAPKDGVCPSAPAPTASVDERPIAPCASISR
jgi:hypothetical protein